MTAVNPISSVLAWLRKGYPDGVPPKDFVPLVALLTRTLDDDELDKAVGLVIAGHPNSPAQLSDVRDAIARVKAAPPVESDVREVAARLAAVGWPLGVPGPAPDAHPVDNGGGVIERVLNWLRAGYPDGIPPVDRIPVLAILQRRLSDDEVQQIVDQLVAHAEGADVISTIDAADLIAKAKNDLPSEEDLDRVRERLAAQGWPLAK